MFARQILSRSALRQVSRSSTSSAQIPTISCRSITQLVQPPLYSTRAEATGPGRDGIAKLVGDENPLEVNLA